MLIGDGGFFSAFSLGAQARVNKKQVSKAGNK
jgi:hypothetical protein